MHETFFWWKLAVKPNDVCTNVVIFFLSRFTHFFHNFFGAKMVSRKYVGILKVCHILGGKIFFQSVRIPCGCNSCCLDDVLWQKFWYDVFDKHFYNVLRNNCIMFWMILITTMSASPNRYFSLDANTDRRKKRFNDKFYFYQKKRPMKCFFLCLKRSFHWKCKVVDK